MDSSDNFHDGKAALEEYVTVAIAEDMDLANEYKDILVQNDIPVVTAAQKSYSSTILGIAVMVPEHCLEQAQEIIESQQVFDDFLSDAFNDNDNFNEPDFDYFDDDDLGLNDDDY